MKLLVTGDWHYRTQNPVARLDDFQAVLNAKIREVGRIALDNDVDAIVVPGDLTDSPSPAYSTLTALENAVREIDRPFWAIPGNHDLYAGSQQSLSRTAYGHLASTGLVRDLSARPFATGCALVEGDGFSTDTDSDVGDYITKRRVAAGTVRIVVAHGMLLERAPGFEMKHTLLTDVAGHADCPHVCITGHEHLGYGVKRLPRAAGGEVVFINPGALIRLSAHPAEIERMPQVCLLEIYPGVAPFCPRCGGPLPSNRRGDYIAQCPKCGQNSLVGVSDYGPPEIWTLGYPVIEATLIPLSCARPGHEVLSREHIEAAADRDAMMGRFLGLLANEGETKFLDLQSMIEGIARSEGLPRTVVAEALARIAAARETLGKTGIAG